MIVRDCNCKGVGEAFARAQALHRGQQGIQRISIVAVGVHAERAVVARCIAQWREADRIVHIRVRGRGQRAAGGGAAFSDVHACGGQHGRVISPVYGHGQGIGGCGAVAVGHREGEAVGEAFAHAQALHRRQRIIQHIGIVAVGVHVERAVLAGGIALGDESHCIMGIRVHGHGQRAADVGRILNNGGRRRCHCGRVVCPVDGHGQDAGGRAAVIVGCRERKGISEAFPHAQALHRGQRIIQDIGVIA